MSLEKKFIDYFELREKDAMEMLTFCLSKNLSVKDSQKYVKQLCDNFVDVFINRYQTELVTTELLVDSIEYLKSIGAHDKYTGHRFGNALCKKLVEMQNRLDSQKNEQTLEQAK